MSEHVLPQGPEFQRAVLRLMMQDKSFCALSLTYLKENFFGGELSWFFRQISILAKELGRHPTSDEVGSRIYLQVKEKQKFEDEFKHILASTNLYADFIKKELPEFWKRNLFITAFRQAQDHWVCKDYTACYERIGDMIKEISRANFDSERLVRFDKMDEAIEASRQQTVNAIPTGIHHIDEAMHGGMMPQTWTTFLGGSNVGKSMLCASLARMAYLYTKKKTFVLVHEDEELPTQMRYLSCFSGVPYNRLALPSIDRSEEENRDIKDAKEILQEYVAIRFMYGKESFIENVITEAKLMKEQWDYSLFIDDYLQCLKVRSIAKMDSLYALHEYNTQELKQICCELNVAGAGGAQVNREGHRLNQKGSDFLRTTDVGDSWGIVKKSSNVITMNRSDQNKELNQITFLLDKVRHGVCPVAARCNSDYNCCRTHLPWDEQQGNQTQLPVGTK